jgi:hypothetical protein
MALPADVVDADWTTLFMHESLEQMKKIQTQVPELVGQTVSLLMDPIGLPAYSTKQEAGYCRRFSGRWLFNIH